MVQIGRDIAMNEEEEEAMLTKEEEDDDDDIISITSTSSQSPATLSGKMMAEEIAKRLKNGDLTARIEAARDVRRIVRKSPSLNSKSAVRSRLAAAGVIEPLVCMLNNWFPIAAREAALLAILNVAARNQRNKIRIVTSGAISPLVELLKYKNGNLRELSAAAILSLSSVEYNKPTISAAGVASLLVQVLCTGSVQAKVDVVTALYNLSTYENEPKPALDPKSASPLIKLLKECKKYSKFAEKTTFLLEILSHSEEGRNSITNSDCGILTLVETVEDGSRLSMLYAVGALLSLCQSSRDKYRELILREGAIPGLLRLTAEGTSEAQDRARKLLDLLRESRSGNRMSSLVLEKIVYDFAAKVDGSDKAAMTAKRILQGMVQKSMELSLSNRFKLRDSSGNKLKIRSA